MLPSVAEYLARLPNAETSYPHATVKAAVTRAMIETTSLAEDLRPGDVPDPILELVHRPPTVNQWLPEVFHGVLGAATYDTMFRDHGGMPAFRAWVLDGNRKLLRGPLYRVLFLVLSPERIFLAAGRRWEAFHRGSTLRVLEHTARDARARLTYPPGLFGELSCNAFAGAFTAAAEAAGAKDVVTRAQIESDTSTLYSTSWN
jgi:hypothetical protein